MAEIPRVRSALWQVVALNLAVALTKGLCGSLFHSAAMTATGFYSLSTGAVSLAVLVSTRRWRRMAAALLLLVSLGLAVAAIERVGQPVGPAVSVLTFSLMLFNVAATLGIYLYEVRTARRLGSPLLQSDSAHVKDDVLTSCIVLGGLVGIWLGTPALDWLLALIIAARIAQAARSLLRLPRVLAWQ